MRKSLPWLLFLAFALGAACSAAVAQDAQVKIEQYMQASVKVDHFMGSILVAQHGKIIVSQGYGMADMKAGIPNAPDTKFRIASVSKEFTAMAIMELQASGKLNIQDSVCKYVPDCPKDWAPITIYNLLTHTSGIPNLTSFPNYGTIEAEQLTPTQLLADFENKPLNFAPGTKFSYSNSGYDVLGYIIKRVSDESYAEYLEKSIFGPLDMTDSGCDTSHPTAKDHAQGYRYSPSGYEPARFVNMSVPFSAGALYSTVLDLYKWDQAVDAGKLIPNNLMDAMLTGHVAKDGPGSAKYGFGWTISTEFGHKVIWHGGELEGFTSLNSWSPNNDAYVIVLDNMTSPDVLEIGHALAAILFGQKYEVPKEHREIALDAGALGKFVGTYQLAPNFVIAITLAGDQLSEQATGQKACPIFPESSTEFFLKAVDAQISFEEDSAGKVTGLVFHQDGHDLPGKKE
jgi:CubicO group peptidase (beta-lactamase class C family)